MVDNVRLFGNTVEEMKESIGKLASLLPGLEEYA
jgi:hypothetical protein